MSRRCFICCLTARLHSTGCAAVCSSFCIQLKGAAQKHMHNVGCICCTFTVSDYYNTLCRKMQVGRADSRFPTGTFTGVTVISLNTRR